MAELLEATSAQIRDIIGLPESAFKLGPIFSIVESGTNLDIGESADPYITLNSVATKSVIVKKVLDMNTVNKIVNLADPTLAQDAATKNYVDTEIASQATFADNLFRITDNVDPTKQIAFEATNITTATTRTITMPDSDVRLVDTPDGQILDVNINAHVSTKITINAKLQLNGAIVYNDQANVFGDFNQDFKDDKFRIFNPTDTFSYTFVAAALAFNVNLNLPLLTTDDNIVTEAFAQPLTNKTFNLTNNTLEDTANAQGDLIKHNATKFVRFGIGTGLQQIRVNAGGTDLEYFTPGAGTGTLSIVRLEGTDIATNRIALNFLDTGTINMTVVDDGANNEAEISATIVPGSIGNGEIAVHTSTQITILNKAQLNSAIVYDDVVNNFQTNAWQFGQNILQIQNPANTFQYTFAGSAIIADRIVTLPLLGADDAFVMAAAVQIITNKRFTAFANTFATGSLLIENPANTFRYTIQSGAITGNRTIRLPVLTAQDDMVTEAHPQDLSNKTLGSGMVVSLAMTWQNARQIFSPASNAGINFGQTSTDPTVLVDGDVFYRNSDDKFRGVVNAVYQSFVFEAVTQTLSNKTLTTPTIASFVNAAHDHSNAAGGSQLTNSALTSGVFPAITGVGAQSQALDMGTSNKIVNLADPTANQDAATRKFVLEQVTALSIKASCRVATTGNITLSGNQTIDGVTTVDGDRVLVKDQTLGENNGIYISDTGAWARSTDTDTASEIEGMACLIQEGTTLADTGWLLQTDPPIILGTTVLVYVQFTALGQITAGDGLTKTGNTLDVGPTAGRISVSADAVDIDAAYVGQTSITTLGTIAIGVWEGTIIAKSFLPATTVFTDFANVWGAFDQNIATGGSWQEGGVSISPIGPQDAPLTASFFQDRATNGTAPPGGIQTRELPTNDVNIHFFEFTNAGGVQAIQGQTMLPRNFDNTNITVFIYWTAESGTGNVAWRVRLLFRSNDDPLDAAFGAETEIVDTFIVANDTHVSGSAVLTVSGSADNDFVIAQVERNPGAANDTFTGDAQFLGMKIVPTLDAAVAA